MGAPLPPKNQHEEVEASQASNEARSGKEVFRSHSRLGVWKNAASSLNGVARSEINLVYLVPQKNLVEWWLAPPREVLKIVAIEKSNTLWAYIGLGLLPNGRRRSWIEL